MPGFYTYGLKCCMDGTIDLDSATLKWMLIGNTTAYTFSSAHTAVDAGGANDLVDAELNISSGYVRAWGGAGRKLATITMQKNDTSDRVEITQDPDLTWTSLESGDTIVAAVLVKEGGANDTTSIPILYIDLTSDVPTNGSDITLDFPTLAAGGVARVTFGTGLYNEGWFNILKGDYDLGVTAMKVLLRATATTYTFNNDHTAVDAGGANDLVDSEINCTNYTRGWGGAGRQTASISLGVAADAVNIIITDITWTSLGGAANQTIDGATLIKEGVANDTTSVPIADFNVTNKSTNGGNVTLDFSPTGNIRFDLV